MRRIGELDLPARLAPAVPRWLTVVLTGLGCAAAAFFVRATVDIVVPGVAPFAFVFPAILLATLLAHWEGGAIAGGLALFYAWEVLLPRAAQPGDPTGVLALVVVAISCVMCIAIAEAFRLAVCAAAAERDREIANRDLDLAEFDHRVKNNFAIVASLLDMQRRRAKDPGTGDALTVALNRVQSIARAHRHLYRGGSGERPGTIEISDYMADLCTTLSDALLLRGAITLSCTSDNQVMKRDRAVSIGLVANELVTNAAKHAFRGRDAGRITVSYAVQPGRSSLTVEDDGVGVAASVGDGRDGGLGTRLIDAFARQAHGTLATESGEWGTRVRLELDG